MKTPTLALPPVLSLQVPSHKPPHEPPREGLTPSLPSSRFWPPLPLTASDLVSFSLCPRITFFQEIMGFSEHQQRRFKVQKGRQIHRERSSSPLPFGLPPVVKRLKNPRLFANHGLYSGEPDEVLFFSDGSVSPLDYKFSPSSSSPAPSHRFQLLFYALLLSETFELPVHQGFLLFCRDEDVLLPVPLPSASFDDLFHAILQIHRIRQEGYFPPPTETPSLCSSCAFRKVCPFDPLDDSDLFASDAFSPSPPDHDL